MTKVVGSKRTFTDVTDEEAIEFVDIVSDIVALDEYQKMKNYTHHIGYTRYQHCLNVAWYTYLWCKRSGLNYKSATRGAMLHDFYLYDQHKGEQPIPGRHVEVHPMVALANADKYFEVDEIMYDCITHHMFPSTSIRPVTMEGYIVSIADKYCAGLEVGKTGVDYMSPYVKEAIKKITE